MRYFHTALSVTSIEKSRKFYEEVFGLILKAQGERPELGVKFLMLEDKSTETVIELFEHKKPVPLKEDLMDFQRVGVKHVALLTTLRLSLSEQLNMVHKLSGLPRRVSRSRD